MVIATSLVCFCLLWFYVGLSDLKQPSHLTSGSLSEVNQILSESFESMRKQEKNRPEGEKKNEAEFS